jgi:hypothetical protein
MAWKGLAVSECDYFVMLGWNTSCPCSICVAVLLSRRANIVCVYSRGRRIRQSWN